MKAHRLQGPKLQGGQKVETQKQKLAVDEAREVRATETDAMHGGAPPPGVKLVEAPLLQHDPNGISPEERKAYEAANQKLVGKYPTLDKLCRDPDAFVADVKGRFEAQKALTPRDPYAFDFGDYGLPVIKSYLPALEKEMREVEAGPHPSADKQQGIAYLEELHGEVQEHLKSGTLTYRRLQELSYFVARALGHFDQGAQTLKDRVLLKIDRGVNGMRGTNLNDEIRRYHANDFHVMEKKSLSKGPREAGAVFDKAFFNPEKLELISLPSTEELGKDMFERLANYDVFLMGVTPDALPGDGFVRPGGDFWLHDFVHSSIMFTKRQQYKEEHGVNDKQFDKLMKRADVWGAELEQAMAGITDPDLKQAVHFVLFNHHHDRGYPFAPSSYRMKVEDRVPHLLAATMKVSHQHTDMDFKKTHATIDAAYDWLRQFWAPRLGQERAIVGDINLFSTMKM